MSFFSKLFGDNEPKKSNNSNPMIDTCIKIINECSYIIDNTQSSETAISSFSVIKDNLERIFAYLPEGSTIEMQLGGQLINSVNDLYLIDELQNNWLKDHQANTINKELIYQNALNQWIMKFNEANKDGIITEDELLELDNLQENLGLLDQDTSKYLNNPNKQIENIQTNHTELDSGNFEQWRLAVLFGKSSSNIYKLVISSISIHPKYKHYEGDNGEEINEITFGPEEILEFNELWKRIKSWKSTIVKINDNIVDTKILNKMLLCYCDKIACNKTNPLFCYGASPFTFNLFGCHRTMIRDGVIASQKSWFHIGKFDTDGIFYVDKKAITAIILKNVSLYNICPALQLKNIKRGLDIIPDTINPYKNRDWSVQKNYDGSIYLVPTIHYKEQKFSTLSENVGGKNIQIETTIAMADYYNSVSPQFNQIISEKIKEK